MKLYYNNDICNKCGNLTDHRNGKTCSTCYKAWKKNYHAEHREEAKAYQKTYQKTYRAEHKDEVNEYNKNYHKTKLNTRGIRLSSVRNMSNIYLYNVLNQPKLDNYEIHHCFGYEDHTKFIYIPKSLHLEIHKYLRDNNIDAMDEHFKDIEHLLDETQDTWYDSNNMWPLYQNNKFSTQAFNPKNQYEEPQEVLYDSE